MQLHYDSVPSLSVTNRETDEAPCTLSVRQSNLDSRFPEPEGLFAYPMSTHVGRTHPAFLSAGLVKFMLYSGPDDRMTPLKETLELMLLRFAQ